MEQKKNKITDAQSYLTFKLDKEEFAVHVSNVLNILELKTITKVPKTPEYMKGVINLRGSVLPVIDTRLKLGLAPIEYTNNTCIVVMEMNIENEKVFIGSLVDKVEAVHEIEKQQIRAVPELTGGINTDFLKGIVEIDEQFIMMLDIEKIFTTKEIQELSNV